MVWYSSFEEQFDYLSLATIHRRPCSASAAARHIPGVQRPEREISMDRLEFLVQALVDFLVAVWRGVIRARDWVIDAARKGFRLARSGLPAFKFALAFIAA